MEENTKKTTKENNFPLILTLAILIIMIIGLGAGIFVLRLGKKPQVTVPETMEGWDGPISDSTKALMFSEEIDERIESNDYSYEDAVRDYGDALDSSQGDLKVYMAIAYANFVFNEKLDLDKAVGILDSVSDLVHGNVLENAYNGTYYDLYSSSGEVEEADYYLGLINQNDDNEVVSIPLNEAIRMMGGEVKDE